MDIVRRSYILPTHAVLHVSIWLCEVFQISNVNIYEGKIDLV